MWVYQFGYLDQLRGFGDRPVWINPLWFWEYHPTGKTRPQDEVERSLASMVKDGRGNATTEIKKVGTVKRYRFFRDHKDLQLP